MVKYLLNIPDVDLTALDKKGNSAMHLCLQITNDDYLTTLGKLKKKINRFECVRILLDIVQVIFKTIQKLITIYIYILGKRE